MPGQHGGCVYPHGLLTELHRRGVAIDYAWLGKPLAGGRRIMRHPLQADFVQRGWVRGARPVGGLIIPSSLREFFSGADPDDAPAGEHLPTPDEQAFAAGVIRRCGIQAVLIDGTATLPVLDRLSSAERARLRVGVLTHNVNSRRTDLYRSHGQPLDFLPMTTAEETALLARADVIVAIQEREAEAFRRMLPGHRVVTVPMPVRAIPQPEKSAIAGRCVFVGGFSGHNIEALQWLLRDIWPQVRAAHPAAELVVAGTVGKAVANPPPGVRLIGPLSDLGKFYAEASVSLVPLPMGTGLKIKLVEAMGQGRAVVTTRAGAEGFAELEEGRVAVVADDAPAFAAAVVKLLGDPEWRRAVAARQLAWIGRQLDPEHVLAPLNELWSASKAGDAVEQS